MAQNGDRLLFVSQIPQLNLALRSLQDDYRFGPRNVFLKSTPFLRVRNRFKGKMRTEPVIREPPTSDAPSSSPLSSRSTSPSLNLSTNETLSPFGSVEGDSDSGTSSNNSSSSSSNASTSSSESDIFSIARKKKLLLERLMSYFFLELFPQLSSPASVQRPSGGGGGGGGTRQAFDDANPSGSYPSLPSSTQKQKGKRLPEEDNDQNSGDGGGHKKVRLDPPDDPETTRLGCPYFKNNPQRYRTWQSCPGPGWSTVYRLNQLKLLRSRKKGTKHLSEADKWRDVYLILFPGTSASEIPSPYLDFGGSGDTAEAESAFARYEQYLRRELPKKVRRELEARIDQALEPLEESLKSQIVEIVRDAQASLYENFLSASSGTSENERACEPFCETMSSAAGGQPGLCNGTFVFDDQLESCEPVPLLGGDVGDIGDFNSLLFGVSSEISHFVGSIWPGDSSVVGQYEPSKERPPRTLDDGDSGYGSILYPAQLDLYDAFLAPAEDT
ncbi:hypothetical protein CPLU01_07933 [Colletotrichum plurivorum]|uniref:Uncharacterized protein n=1 Tax=Colletotrichum plurivorum TaxID=2175906 RepID=A0A8H6KDN5_9PEZI|nr:hypothetical protein CPLU01_07933 [Colletotrichum plurivorum]